MRPASVCTLYLILADPHMHGRGGSPSYFLAGKGGRKLPPGSATLLWMLGNVAIESPTDTLCQDPSRARATIGVSNGPRKLHLPGAPPGDIVTVVWLSMIGGPSLAYMDVCCNYPPYNFHLIMHLGAAWGGWANYRQSLSFSLSLSQGIWPDWNRTFGKKNGMG